MAWFGFLVLLLLILTNGVLAMSEIALVSANRVRLQQRAKSGSSSAAAALQIAADPNRFLATVQIGITLVGILAGAYGGVALSSGLADRIRDLPVIGIRADAVALGLVVVCITYLTLVVGELVPKRIALQNAERISGLVARPMLFVSRVAAPLVWLLGKSTNLILVALRVKKDNGPSVTEEEVAILLQQGAIEGVFERSEHEMVMNVFGLGDRIASEVMTPRVRVVAIDINASQDEIERTISETGHQSFPVIDGDLDRISGVVSINDLWQALLSGESALEGPLRQPSYVPETMPAFRLLEHLQRSHEDFAFVVNEYGAVEGIVTIRDIVEEILGMSIRRPDAQPIVMRADGSWLVDGLVSLHEIEDVVGVAQFEAWSEGRYQTLGGFMMGELNRIPFVSDIVTWNNWQFEVVDMDGNRVDRVMIAAVEPSQDA